MYGFRHGDMVKFQVPAKDMFGPPKGEWVGYIIDQTRYRDSVAGMDWDTLRGPWVWVPRTVVTLDAKLREVAQCGRGPDAELAVDVFCVEWAWLHDAKRLQFPGYLVRVSSKTRRSKKRLVRPFRALEEV